MFQYYLVFIPAKKYIKYFSNTTWIDSQKSNVLFNNLQSNVRRKYWKYCYNSAPTFVDHHVLSDINFYGTVFQSLKK